MTLSWNDRHNRRQPATNGATATVHPINGEQADTAYGLAALRDECEIVAAATEGTRDQVINTAWFRMGRHIGAGNLTVETARNQLAEAARRTGQPEHEIQRALRLTSTGGLAAGAQHPRQPEPKQLDELGPALTINQPAGDIPANTIPADVTPPPDDVDQDQDKTPRPRTSWWPTGLVDRASAADEAPAPTHLQRDDGQALLYSGKVNGLIGESESGKSWIALLAITQALNSGQRILMLDFEDSPSSIHRRMNALGITDQQLDAFDYADPDEALGAVQSEDLTEALGAAGYDVILVDGVNAAMTLLGLDLNSNTDATKFTSKILRPLAQTGACVITVDHVPKNGEQRGKGGIGAQAKRAMMDGCAITVEVAEPFGKGQSGVLKLTVDKDRNGHVRGISAGGKNPGRAHITSRDDQVRINITAPDLRTGDDRPTWHPTAKMEAVSRAIERVDAPLSFRQVKELVTGKESTIREAVTALVEDGFMTVEPGPRGALLHRSVKPFRELTVSPSPTVSRPSPGDGEVSVSRSLSPYGEGDTPRGDGDKRPSPQQDHLDIPADHTHCNGCGQLTPDQIIDETGGYCRRCSWRVNGQ